VSNGWLVLTTRVIRRRPGNCLASFGCVSLLSRIHVEPDVVSQSVIVVQTRVAGKVDSYVRHERYSEVRACKVRIFNWVRAAV
jgi:hypothetical protein